jgi:hypothetical protein
MSDQNNLLLLQPSVYCPKATILPAGDKDRDSKISMIGSVSMLLRFVVVLPMSTVFTTFVHYMSP